VADVIRKVLTGSGECHQVNWTFLTLAMPTWVLIAASALGVLGVYANIMGQLRGAPPLKR
jgi:disulfide bond formation protein DsbB